MTGKPETEDTPPRLGYWHVWTDDDGTSRQTRCELSDFAFVQLGARAPAWIDALEDKSKVVFGVLPAGVIGDWHENPKPQWIVPLSGRWFVETMDGMRVEMGPGELSFGGDQNTKRDAQGRFGHRSGAVGSEPATLMLVQLEDETMIGARPGAFR